MEQGALLDAQIAFDQAIWQIFDVDVLANEYDKLFDLAHIFESGALLMSVGVG